MTGEGILGLAKLGHLPDIPLDFILDKSKADNVTKTLVIIQATWLLIQYIPRLAAHLPLTLLEINSRPCHLRLGHLLPVVENTIGYPGTHHLVRRLG